MFRDTALDQPTKLQERNLLHKRITDLTELREVYVIGEVIGKGNFGTVVKAKHKETKVSWAIKVINKRQAGASRVLSVEREIYILKLVEHPNVIFLDCVFESPKVIYLVFELCTGSLAKIFNAKNKQFQESETVNVIRRLSCALSYLHKNDIVHRDLKLENILTADNPNDSDDNLFIKVTDFGLSAMRTGPGHDNMLHDCCGTLAYMAPEMIATKSYSQQCDVWSMGIIMYLLLFGEFPFFSVNDQQLCALIGKVDIDFSGLSCSAEAKNLLSKLLERNPAFRLTAAEVKNHPWISGIADNLQTESSNVLDMMHQWRDEMLESPEDDNNKASTANKHETIGIAERKDGFVAKDSESSLATFVDDTRSSKQLWVNAERSRTSTNIDVETARKLMSPPVVESTSQDANSRRTQTTKEESTNKQSRRKSSRLPDFSHIPAKVDSNLVNLRKEAKRKREATRKLVV